MMEKLKLFTRIKIVFTIGLITGSCVDLNEQTPGSLTTVALYKSQADLEAAAIGLYSPLFGNYAAFDFDWPIVMTAGGEDVDSQAGIFRRFDELRADPTSGAISTMWNALYKSINNANNIIGNLENVPQTEARDQVEGQARFIRGMNYFFLTRWFGEVQLITFGNQSEAGDVEQSSIQEIYDFIVGDLLIAENLLPTTYEGIHARPTSGAAKAVLAKVYLTMAGWPLNQGQQAYALAKSKAAELITGVNAGNYSLEADFSRLWDGNNKFMNTEFIFILHGISANGSPNASHHHVASRPPVDGGWGDWYSEERFLNAFPAGPRKDASFRLTFSDGSDWSDNNVPGGGPGQPFTAKYRNPGGACGFDDVGCPEHGDGFFPIIRYADVLLIYAEAANQSDGAPSFEAYEAVNMVRRRAAGLSPNTPDVTVDLAGLSSQDFDRAVLNERNWELAFEANRWFDLVRRELVIEVNAGVHDGVTVEDYWLPKPALQVDLSSGLRQNIGY